MANLKLSTRLAIIGQLAGGTLALGLIAVGLTSLLCLAYPPLVDWFEAVAWAIVGMLSCGGYALGLHLWQRRKFDPDDISQRAADLYFRGIDPSENAKRPADDV